MPETLDISFDSTTSADNPAFFQPADPSGATGLNHVVDTTNVSVTFFQKDGTMLMRDTLQNFFAGFAPETFLFDARVIYDHYWDRFVLVAMEHTEVGLGDPSDRSEMLIAVSDDGDPAGTWHMAQVFTLLSSFDPDGPGPLPPGPHWADFPIIGMERQQLYLTFRMNSFGATPTFGGTTIWNIFKWDVVDPSPSGGFYGGQNATIHAGIRPFSLNNDFANEVPLAPAYFHGTIVANPVDRGMFFVGYSGASLSGDSTIQVFWVTTVGPSASKLIVQLGTIDNIGMCSAFPDAPQMGSAILLETNCREVLDAVWRDDTLTFVTQIEPLGGSDAGEATAHWVQFSAPDPSTITLSGQGDISGDVVAPNAHTFYPAIRVDGSGNMGLSYALSAVGIHVSSFASGIDPDAALVLAPEALRIGTDAYERGVPRWGDYSSVSLDPVDDCFWVYNVHAIARDPMGSSGDDGRWGTAHGTFCFDFPVLFTDGFESGDTSAWSTTVP